jgi:AcrR family transcriptional regulator
MSRRSTQQTTRASFLAAAARLCARGEWGASSLDRIADEAGCTRGAFYPNFDSKADLLLSATEDVLERHIAAVDELDARAEAQAWFAVFPRFGEWFALTLEAWLLAEQDARAKARLQNALGRLRGRLAKFLELCAATGGAAGTLSFTQVSSAMIALRIGLLLQKRIERDAFPDGTYAQVVGRLLGQTTAMEDPSCD